VSTRSDDDDDDDDDDISTDYRSINLTMLQCRIVFLINRRSKMRERRRMAYF